MTEAQLFQAAFPFQDDVLALPVADIETSARWYHDTFGLEVVSRSHEPCPTVIMERDGFAQNGGDPEQDGAAILVADAALAKAELEAKGVTTGNWRIDERDGQRFQVFFVVAPDGLCFYFHQRLADGEGVSDPPDAG